jgi:hypothetical protein
MHAYDQRRFARRFTDRIGCARRGHSWRTAEVALGETTLWRGECFRCGSIGRIHRAEHRHAEQADRAPAADRQYSGRRSAR